MAGASLQNIWISPYFPNLSCLRYANVLECQGIIAVRGKKKTNLQQYILPNAPNVPITINGGMRMPGWYDIKSLSDWDAPQDEDRMLKTVQMVQKLVTDEVDSGISSDRIIVGGFSQGTLCCKRPFNILKAARWQY